MPRKNLIKNVRRIVVKIGSSSITQKGTLSGKKISGLVADVAGLLRRGYQIVIVTSGAIPAGAGALNRAIHSHTIPEKQALASLGQTILMNEYRKKFRREGYEVGQILLTEDDVKHRRRYLNARHTFEALFKFNIVPIVNENDSVVVKEIKFGDNDTLSAHVTSLINADLLILLSDIDGFYMDLGDPEPLEEIHELTEEICGRAGGSSSECGTGGMVTKIRAAEMILRFGEKMIIANGGTPGILNRIMDGEKIGTIFVSRERPLSSRKKWLTLGKVVGRVRVDDGAVAAIRDGKKSLLASGIVEVDGDFDMGDFVEITDTESRAIGKGIVNYSNDELAMIRGMKSDEIKRTLGSKFFNEVINRDDLVIY